MLPHRCFLPNITTTSTLFRAPRISAAFYPSISSSDPVALLVLRVLSHPERRIRPH
jgi:hypothetical protein